MSTLPREIMLMDKKHASLQEYYDLLGVENTEELRRTLSKLFNHSNMVNKLISDATKVTRSEERKKEKSSENFTESTEKVEKRQDIIDEKHKEEEKTMIEEVHYSSIEQLEADEKLFSDACIELECRHKEMCARKRAISMAVFNYSEELQEMRNRVKNMIDHINKLESENDQLSSEMKIVFGDIEGMQEILEEIRREKEILKRVTFLVFAEAIAVENFSVNIPEVDSNGRFAELMGEALADPRCEAMTVGALKNIVQMVIVVNDYLDGRQYEIQFETEEMKEMFNKLIKQK